MRKLAPAAAVMSCSAVLWGCSASDGKSAHEAQPALDSLLAASPEASSEPIAATPDAPAPLQSPRLGARSFAVTAYAEPKKGATKLGYLRVGAIVERSAERVSRRGCKGGWYKIQPRGYICAGRAATVDLEDPLLRAAAVRPRRDRPMPYRYGFVRAVLPYYLRVPDAQQQFKSEFKLQEHLDWFKENKSTVQKAELGADDVPIDGRGVALSGKKVGELGYGKASTEMSLGELFGGNSDDDRRPFWLRDGARLIPNISGFDVPEYAVFADRARRHTGLAFVGSFATGSHSLRRRFAVTTDLRLVPTTKVKPDSASPWHGVELGKGLELPIAFVSRRGAQAYRVQGSEAVTTGELPRRSVHRLAGKVRKVDGIKYYLTTEGTWLHQEFTGVVVKPRKLPAAAARGEKWIEVDLSEQVLVLWEGKTPVYATLVSTGRPAIGDPDETHATPRGTFRIYAKHLSATMDSDEGASGRKQRRKPGDEGYVPEKGDGQYGVTLRRGHGLFKLRDVPHIQYFAKSYAIHGAYWHDVFGIPRSHGCINLAPVDSHRVFEWTEPRLPDQWHGINTDKGTVVIIHK